MIPRYRSPLRLRQVLACLVRRPAAVADRLPAAGNRAVAAWLPSASDALRLWLHDRAPTGTVVVPAYTCIRVSQAIRAAGWTPVYVDIDPQSLAMPVAGVAALLGRISRPAAILATHVHGVPVPMAELRALATAEGVLLVEDCAMAQGACAASGAPVGSDGDAAIHSFGLGKVVGTGFGGALVADGGVANPATDPQVGVGAAFLAWLARAGAIGTLRFALQEAVKRLLRYRREPGTGEPFHASALTVDAARRLSALVTAPEIDAWIEQRRARCLRWWQFVQSLHSERLRVPELASGASPCSPGLPLLATDRDALDAALRALGVDTARFFDYCAATLDGADGEFPGATAVSGRILLLPMDPEIDRVEAQVRATLAAFASAA